MIRPVFKKARKYWIPNPMKQLPWKFWRVDLKTAGAK